MVFTLLVSHTHLTIWQKLKKLFSENTQAQDFQQRQEAKSALTASNSDPRKSPRARRMETRLGKVSSLLWEEILSGNKHFVPQ